MFIEMGSLGVDGCDIIIKGIEKLPETYRKMIHGGFIGKPIVQIGEIFLPGEPNIDAEE